MSEDSLKIGGLSVINDSKNIRQFLKDLLIRLWIEKECFSGKRPFGNSGWDYLLYTPLIEAGIVAGKIDEDGYIAEIDEKKADKIILDYIQSEF